MRPGDLVKTKKSREFHVPKVGLFVGLRTFGCEKMGSAYTCAEVMWFHKRAPNGDAVSTIQHDLIEVINESG